LSNIIAEFVGGPKCGTVMAIPDLRSRWLFPVIGQLSFYSNENNDLDVETKVIVYDIILDPAMKLPSMNDSGEYRYGYKGIQ
jgi:hypothetical protein